MATTKLGLTNRLEASGVTLLNGTGGGEPALEQHADFPMTNLFYRDSETVWRTSDAPTSPVQIDIDLGSSLACSCAALLNLRAASTQVLTTCTVQSAAASPGGPWTTRGTIALTAHLNLIPIDAGGAFDSVSARYWRFEITDAGSGWYSIGKLWLGVAQDLGFEYFSNEGWRHGRTRRRREKQGEGAPILFDGGRRSHDFSMPMPDVTSTPVAIIETLSTLTQPFVLFPHEGQAYEVFIPGGRDETEFRFASLYSTGLQLASLR